MLLAQFTPPHSSVALPQPAKAPRKRKGGKEGRRGSRPLSRQGRGQKGCSLQLLLLNPKPPGLGTPARTPLASGLGPGSLSSCSQRQALTDRSLVGEPGASLAPSSNPARSAQFTTPPAHDPLAALHRSSQLRSLTEGFLGQTAAPGFPASAPKTPVHTGQHGRPATFSCLHTCLE